jgi:hypothetical protein
MAAGPIPWTSIVNWAQFHEMTDPDDFAVLVHHIRALEEVLSKHQEEQRK